MKEPKNLFNTELKVMEYLAKHGETTGDKLTKISGSRSRSPWQQFLYRIEDVGYIAREHGKYVLTDKGRTKLEKEKSPSISGMTAAVGPEEYTDLSQVTSDE